MSEINHQKDPLEVIGRARGYSREELIINIKRHANFTPNLLKQIQETPEVVLRNLGTPQCKKIIKMMKEVFKEAYRAKQFTRTKLNNNGVLYGVVSLNHNVIDIILNYFHERWPNCIICLYNEKTHKTGVINEGAKIVEIDSPLKNVVKNFSRKRQIFPNFSDIQFSSEKIFEALYNSQNITERENNKYFHRMIPKTCYLLPGMREGVEKRFKSKKLSDFF